MIPDQPNPLVGQYELACTFVCVLRGPCKGRRILSQSFSAGWALGDLIPSFSADPSFARCPVCRRHSMKVTKVPEIKTAPVSNGFSSVPEK